MANVECNIEQSRNLSNSVPNIDLNDSISSIAPFENDPDLDIYQLIANPDKFEIMTLITCLFHRCLIIIQLTR